MEKVGLILNVIGSVLFLIDSHKLGSILSKMIGQIAEGYGKFDGESFTQQQLLDLNNAIHKSKRLQLVGAVFFILGFILQLV